MSIKYREIMRAEQSPDVYDGPNCDQHRARWVGSAEGDMDGDGEISDTIALSAATFPPGTRVAISVPLCPDCGESADVANDQTEKCECGFDWKAWANDRYS